MGASKAPVVLVKPKATPALDASVNSLYDRMAGKSGMMVLVCVDGTKLSQKSFDMALRFVKRGDTVHAVHVQNTDESMANPVMEELALLGKTKIMHDYMLRRAAGYFSSINKAIQGR